MLHGEQAQAVVLENRPFGNHAIRRLRLRVHFEDGSTTEVRRIEGHPSASVMHVGKRVPMRFDGARPERAQVDVAVFDHAFQAWITKSEADAIRRAEDELP